MGANEFSFNSVDRQHELQGEHDEDFDKQLAKLSARHAAAMRNNATAGHEQTLESLDESLSHRIADGGGFKKMIRAGFSCGPLAAGQMLLDLVGKCIEEDAETAALVEMDRAERAGGLDFAAIRAAASQELRVPA